ncbi:MAG: putative rRNA maturation factor [Candidatus Giovannonibacteria bacterium GW2011_GWA2_53_7]|uniref:Endoribonuclease YbeY n=1 Tax=Candidatus Giovannonibacteria bacterium GW2011_GWA2_53_7 TaxID=1618650 RepID=A0A0G1XV57_9BACT|nr:MAG: putative rRNA maturation factor [Candidatus Giovannonibacteria bacterium GW2011_GWA2_53_7]
MIHIEYAPGRTRGEGRLSEVVVKKTAQAVSRALKLKESFTISLALIDGPSMRRLNGFFRGKDAVTDVLAFAYAPEQAPGAFGEVLICPSRAREQAKEVGRALQDEMIELLVHGLLHVFGHDHIKTKDALVMLPLQQKILKTLL